MKRCAWCKLTKPRSEFGFKDREKGTLQAFCKECNKEYHRDHYQRNKRDYKLKAKKWNQETRQQNAVLLWDYLLEHPCVDCGEPDPIVLQFDHVRGNKRNHVCDMAHRNTWSTVLEEIAKCEVRCANCHARKTAKQLGWYRNRFLAPSSIG